MGRFLTPTVLAIAKSLLLSVPFALFFAIARRWMPRNQATESAGIVGDKEMPYGVAGAIMWALGILVAGGGFLLLRGANHLFGTMDQGAILTLYPASVWWAFLPGFAALLIPWLVTLNLLRRFGYGGKAASIVAKGNAKIGVDGERLMRWMAWGILVPLALATALAWPSRMSILPDEVRIVHYGHLKPDTFSLGEARRAFWVLRYQVQHMNDGSTRQFPDLVVVMSDGRRFRANAMGDGDTAPRKDVVALLLRLTGLRPEVVTTQDEVR